MPDSKEKLKLYLLFKGGVVDVSIHPSGKMALSIGKDKKLVTWNLVCMKLSCLARILQARGATLCSSIQKIILIPIADFGCDPC